MCSPRKYSLNTFSALPDRIIYKRKRPYTRWAFATKHGILTREKITVAMVGGNTKFLYTCIENISLVRCLRSLLEHSKGYFFNAKRPFNTVSILSIYFSVSSMKISLSFWHFEVKMKRCLLERNYLVFPGFCSLDCVHLPLSSPESIQLRDPIRGTLSSRFFFFNC